MTADLRALRTAAEAARRQAYAPYSEFRVGAALLCENGAVMTGCNVENSSFPAGSCAERAALAAAVLAGQQRFAHLVIVTDADVPTPPCGMCRQALVEFAPTLPITSFTAAGAEEHWSLGDLLPHPFTPQSLQHR